MFSNLFEPPPPEIRGSFRMALFLLVVTFVLFAVGTYHAQAHGAYPIECCHDRDCAPIDPRLVKKLPDGSFEVTLGPQDHPMLAEAGLTERRKWLIPVERVRKPLNGDYNICFSPTAAFLCFFDKADGG